MITRRKLLVTSGLGLFATALGSVAQQQSVVPRIGFLWITSDSPSSYTEAFREGLQAQGYVEGRNIRIDERFLVDRYDRLPEAAQRLVSQKVDIIFSYGITATIAASKATSTIPIIMFMGADPVQLGIAKSLSRPGRNVTGIASINTEIAGKRLELLKEAVPGIRRIALVFNPGSSGDVAYRQSSEVAAQRLKLEVRTAEVRSPDEIETNIPAIAKLSVSAIAFAGSSLLNAHQKRVVTAVSKTRLPAVYASAGFAEAGGLMSYAADTAEGFRRAAYYVDKILKGGKPEDLPMEQPTQFELIVNVRAAKAIGLSIPQSILLRADKVIE